MCACVHQLDSQALLSKFVTAFSARGLRTHTAIARGEERACTRDVIDAEAPQLVVLGSRGLSLAKRLVVGSLGSFVVENTVSCPVLLVKPEAPVPQPGVVRSLCFAVQWNDVSMHAFGWMLKYVARKADRITLIHFMARADAAAPARRAAAIYLDLAASVQVRSLRVAFGCLSSLSPSCSLRDRVLDCSQWR